MPESDRIIVNLTVDVKGQVSEDRFDEDITEELERFRQTYNIMTGRSDG